MEYIVKALSPELLNDYLSFFDHMIFSEFPEWSNCYCYELFFTGTTEDWTREKNRKGVRQLIERGIMTGYLAYYNNKPVGWCNANSRHQFTSLERFTKICVDHSENICSIGCFVIHPDHRRKGIATLLLKSAIDDFSKQGFDYMEAYPGKGELSSEKHYKGPLSMYEKAGFSVYKTYEKLYVVRKKLRNNSKSLDFNINAAH